MEEKYWKWMISLVNAREYTRLCQILENIPFTYDLVMDGNRADDGINLRYRFGREMGYSDREIATLDMSDCSVLEMMVALAIRIEVSIMDDPLQGDRTAVWFHEMLQSMELDMYTNLYVDANEVTRKVYRMLNRTYWSTGQGGLFTIPHCREDLRQVEIWYQMCWYFRDVGMMI